MQKYVALVPVKPPALGKSRLVGLTDDARRTLAAAFALDTVAACVSADAIAEVLVATDDASFSLELAALGAVTIPDGVGDGPQRHAAPVRGRSATALAGARPGGAAPGTCRPCAPRTSTRRSAWSRPVNRRTSRTRTGSAPRSTPRRTTRSTRGSVPAPRWLTTPPGRGRSPPPLPRLRRDVDDLQDLDDALALGVGPRTAERAAPVRETARPWGWVSASSRPSSQVPSWRAPSWQVPSWPVPSWQVPSWPVPSWRAPSWQVPSWPERLLRGRLLGGRLLGRRLLGRCLLRRRLLGRSLLRRSLLGRRLLRRPSCAGRLLGGGLLGRSLLRGLLGSLLGGRLLRRGSRSGHAERLELRSRASSCGQLLGARDDVLQVLAGSEFGHLRRLGLDPLASPRVADHACVADSLLEGAEACDRDLLALGHLTADGVEDRLERVRAAFLFRRTEQPAPR